MHSVPGAIQEAMLYKQQVFWHWVSRQREHARLNLWFECLMSPKEDKLICLTILLLGRASTITM